MPSSIPAGRTTSPLDSNWRFHLGDSAGAQQLGFNDSAWESVDVPHDWSISQPFDEHSSTGGAGAFLPAGIGWYRKSFMLPASGADGIVMVEFDGVMANSDVWVNGVHAGFRPNGYVGFAYEITKYVNFGTGHPNVIAVRADNSMQPASRWYAGSGIYRHVRITTLPRIHLAPHETFLSTRSASKDSASVHFQSTIQNNSAAIANVALTLAIHDPTGLTVQTVHLPARSIPQNQTAAFSSEISVRSPGLWNIAHPNIYTATVSEVANGFVADQDTVKFGIRDAHFEAATGFWLNGENIKIKGVCLHGDAGGLGVAVPLSVWQRRLAALKSVGCNAIRTSHNPVAPKFLDLCDRMGFLVLDEFLDTWSVAKVPYDYHLQFAKWAETDVRDSVMRDRNHPSIILYSAGNEIHDTPNAVLAKAKLAALLRVYHESDPTRPVTMALFRPNVSHDFDNGLADMLDVIGTNYRDKELLAAHAAKPSRKIIGTENGHDRSAWLFVRDNPEYAGQFLWTGFDYLGEARAWPTIGSASGLFDRTGEPKPMAWQRQSWWSDIPMVRIARRVAPSRSTPADPGFTPLSGKVGVLADWSPENKEPHTESVEVYSNCQEVELFLNGRSLGSQTLPQNAAPRVWSVPFESGTLRAVAGDGHAQLATDELRTAGPASKIVLTADREAISPSFDDVVYVRAEITDAEGNRIPSGNALVTFAIQGPGVVAAVDNGNNASHESFRGLQRHAYNGSCVAIVRSTDPGKITVTAESAGLKSSSVSIQSRVR